VLFVWQCGRYGIRLMQSFFFNPERIASLLHFYLPRIMPDKDADTATIQLFTQCFALKKHKCGRHLIDDSLSCTQFDPTLSGIRVKLS